MVDVNRSADREQPEIVHVSELAATAVGSQSIPTTPSPAAGSREDDGLRAEMLGKLVGYGLILLITFRAAIWPALPWEAWIKWLVFAGATGLAGLTVISFLARANRFFDSLRNSIVIVVITTGAALAALLFSEAARGEVFKLFVVVYFSLLPAFLYLQFMSIRGRTLWEEYTDNLFRLQADEDASLPEPPRHSRFYRHWKAANPLGHTRTLYQQKFEGVFGIIPGDDRTGPAFHKDKLAPVMMATVLLSVGWVLVVMPGPVVNMWPQAANGDVSPQLPLATVRFGFLGAYFYAVQLLVRRYFQNDLKASAFLNVIMRIVVVVLLTWTVDLTLGDQPQHYRSTFAFVVGVFPDVGWKALQSLIKLPLRPLVRSLRQQYPLSDLDGLNVWYEARLLEEGVEDMQNLATCNLVDVMLNTRIPVDRLIDWVDQSLLYLHLGKPPKDGDGPREKLRRYGIRTATDLEDVLASDQGDAVARLLDTTAGEPSAPRSINAALRCEPNYQHVRAWRSDRRAIVPRAAR